jgi:DNA-binding response OmpR family regulator
MARLVVVEDEPDILLLLATKLRRLGHEVSTAPDGQAGLDLIRQLVPDLVVLDWMMPKLTGLEVCVAVKGDPALTNVPVLLLTARTQPADLEAVTAAGADAYLPKPFTTDELKRAVEGLLGPK